MADPLSAPLFGTLSDTDPEAERVRLGILAAMPLEQKLALTLEASAAMRLMVQEQIRRDHPGLDHAGVIRLYLERFMSAEDLDEIGVPRVPAGR